MIRFRHFWTTYCPEIASEVDWWVSEKRTYVQLIIKAVIWSHSVIFIDTARGAAFCYRRVGLTTWIWSMKENKIYILLRKLKGISCEAVMCAKDVHSRRSMRMCQYIGEILSYSFLNIIFPGISCNPWIYESSLPIVGCNYKVTYTYNRKKYIVIYRLMTMFYIESDRTGILCVPVAVQHGKFQIKLYRTKTRDYAWMLCYSFEDQDMWLRCRTQEIQI